MELVEELAGGIGIASPAAARELRRGRPDALEVDGQLDPVVAATADSITESRRCARGRR